MKFSEAVDIVAKEFLWQTGTPQKNRVAFICVATYIAGQSGMIPREYVSVINRRIGLMISPCTTLAGKLDEQRKFPPEALNMQGKWRLDSPAYIKLRDEFLEQLKKELSYA